MVAKRRQVRVKVVKGGDHAKVLVAKSGDDGVDLSEFLNEEDLDDGSKVITIRIPGRNQGEGVASLGPAAAANEAIGGLHDRLVQLVRQARADGFTWTQIGASLGISKQAAWERFSGEE